MVRFKQEKILTKILTMIQSSSAVKPQCQSTYFLVGLIVFILFLHSYAIESQKETVQIVFQTINKVVFILCERIKKQKLLQNSTACISF